ncbi:unnamed protein product [Ceratitis capitata]|uniref:(Mediterranean fruit fly) hypothetical protein n=1 Tax=Ceratitis capitata TaxID=7213 RepID=A0A811UVS1_CERCA|nr:unnamed protein product [Ceratitis capitata]
MVVLYLNIIASYTANLAAFLTVERMITPIENAEDLASQTEISYGTLESGSTMTFFRDSSLRHIEKCGATWKIKSTAFTTTYEEGIKRVNQGNYAFLMESTMLDYIVQRDCNLTQIGGLLDTKGYGIATPKGSPWRDKMSLSILELQEKGDIQILYDKWWKNASDTCIRKSNNKQTKANALGLDNIGGVFVVLLVGICLAVCVAIFEFWYHYRTRNSRIDLLEYPISKTLEGDQSVELELIQMDERLLPCKHVTAYCCSEKPAQLSLCGEMMDEFRYALRCMDSHKRPAFKRRCPACTLFKDVKDFVNIENRTIIDVHFNLPGGCETTESNGSVM